MRRLLGPLTAALFSGCASLQTPMALAPNSGTDLSRMEVLGPAVGRSKRTYLPLVSAGFSDQGTLKAAMENALDRAGADELRNAVADRRCVAFPAEAFYLFARCETVVRGTAVRYPRQALARRPPAEAPRGRKTSLGDVTPLRDALAPLPVRNALSAYPPASPVEALYRRMVLAEPGEALELGLTLPAEEKQKLLDYMLKTKGRESYFSWKFQLASGLSEREKAFVQWYLQKFTSFRPVP